MLTLDNAKIAVMGLGYVGLPLAVEFGKHLPTLGFDINEERVKQLQNGEDRTLEVEAELFDQSKSLQFSSDESQLKSCSVYIVTVPTPIDEHKQPDLTPLISVSELIGKYLSIGDVVIYESTVYPGTTEEECVPVLESSSGLQFNEDFYVGYSPERINPGDKKNRIDTIVKVTSGSTEEVAIFVDDLYKLIILAGTHRAPTIKVAEAAKVIENTQRDVNIALMNELAIIFNKLNIDTSDVLEAAGTKWNFLPFKPGLVGGHCIGVDPYYLTHKAQAVGYHPNMILAARRINDGMGHYVAGEVVKAMIGKDIKVKGANVLVMGFSFKENCPDYRNTRVIDVIRSLEEYGVQVEIYDPWIDPVSVNKEYNISIVENISKVEKYSGVVLAVAHFAFKDIEIMDNKECVIFDVKNIFQSDERVVRL